ncbi:MAG TPA: ACP S-malonyltransferase [Saprospiraceae bacterium]|jgi:[acyl-carrier-protein] S-malonyltransferase|nr:ACP S-malonyltransferase [Saprospiraceae bacterium]
MSKAYVFPGQGAQYEGMGKDIYMSDSAARHTFDRADDILGYKISEIMFEGSADDLKETRVTQPALFIHALAKISMLRDQFKPVATAGHSLGEFSALVAAEVLTFESGLRLVYERAMAMQDACDADPGTMAAVLGLEDGIVERICQEVSDDLEDIVVAANYNCPGQLVISGTLDAVNAAIEKLKENGAKRAVLLPVGGAFHSPLMEPAQEELEEAINGTTFRKGLCPVYQNYTALAATDPDVIKANLIAQLTGPVRWTQTVENMIKDGILSFVESGGTGKVLSGLIKKVNGEAITESL